MAEQEQEQEQETDSGVSSTNYEKLMAEAHQRASGINETTLRDAGMAYEVAHAQRDSYEAGARRAKQYGEAKDRQEGLEDGSVKPEGVFNRAEELDLARTAADAQRGFARDEFLDARNQAADAIAEETKRREQAALDTGVEEIRARDSR